MAELLQIRTHRVSSGAGADLTDPIISDLESIFRTNVKSSYFDGRAAASGLAEIAFTIIATGAVGLIFKFFEPLVTAAGEAYRDDVLGLIQRHRGDHIPLQIGLGGESRNDYPDAPIRYCFHDRIDGDELLKRMIAANEHLQSIPPKHLSGLIGPTEYSFFWDTETQQWRGCIYGGLEPAYGEFWIPFKGGNSGK